ncbi:MAG: hypothetical protein ACXAE3_04305 [Candidatus Kariarchaeaceae archaeon]|jgi:tRNA pseudouridine-54 N-methylase
MGFIRMIFLVISQRAKAHSAYSLKDLEGHGRIDIIFRTILAATRQLASDQGHTIYCHLKGSEPQGWMKLHYNDVDESHDEVSLAAHIKNNWGEYFTEGTLAQLVADLPRPFALLSEGGASFQKLEGTVILGAQQDLTPDDLRAISPDSIISLGERSLLASHAIIYTRQMSLQL